MFWFCFQNLFLLVLTPSDLWYQTWFPKYRHVTGFVTCSSRRNWYCNSQIAKLIFSSSIFCLKLVSPFFLFVNFFFRICFWAAGGIGLSSCWICRYKNVEIHEFISNFFVIYRLFLGLIGKKVRFFRTYQYEFNSVISKARQIIKTNIDIENICAIPC